MGGRTARELCTAACCALVLLSAWLPPCSAGEGSQAGPTLQFDLPGGSETGPLAPGQAFALSVRLMDWKSTGAEELVAIFESPAFPRRLAPLLPDGPSGAPVTSVVFEPRPFAVGMDDRALRIEVAIARLRGMRIEPVLKRTVYLTIGTRPRATRPDAAIPAPSADKAGPRPDSASAPDQPAAQGQPILPPEEVQEEDLGSGSPAAQSPVYWRAVRETLSRRWQHQLVQIGSRAAARGPRVRFRLYADGLAQLIQVERSSGDPRVDEAGLQAVLASLPFPPFPPTVREPSVEVHLDLPGARR